MNTNLPEYCFDTRPFTGELIILKKGEKGFYPCSWSTEDPKLNKQIADTQNEKLGITAAQRKAMSIGSMFGWDAPRADPKLFEKETLTEKIHAASERTSLNQSEQGRGEGHRCR